MRLPWRKLLWVYRAADGGVCVFILKHGFHITPISANDRVVLLENG